MSERTDNVKQRIEKTDHDLGTAQVTFLYIPKHQDTIAFHCQQAVGKYLKGYLSFLDIPLKKTHSLNYLLSLISSKEKISNDIFDEASSLEDFSVEIRYPDTSINLSQDNVQQASKIVKIS